MSKRNYGFWIIIKMKARILETIWVTDTRTFALAMCEQRKENPNLTFSVKQ